MDSFSYLMTAVFTSLLGFLVGLNIYSIFRMYYWRRAKFHYIVAFLVVVLYIVGVTVWSGNVSRATMSVAVMFCVFYAWRRISIIQAFEHRTGIRVRMAKYTLKELEDPANIEPYEDTLTGGAETLEQRVRREEHEGK